MIHSSQIHKYLIAATFSCISQATIAVTDFPRLDDPQLQEFLTLAQGEYKQYLANKDAYMTRPVARKPWPCALAPEVLNKLASTTNSDDDPVAKQAFVKMARESRTEPIRTFFSNQTFYPVKAECKDNKLDGFVDFWVEYDYSVVSTMFSQNSHQLKHVRLSVDGDKVIGMVFSSGITLSSETIYNDPQTSAMMAKQRKYKITAVSFSVAGSNVAAVTQVPVVSLTHLLMDGEVTVTIDTIRPYADNRVEETHYGSFGSLGHRDYVKRYKDGKRHGEQIIYSGTMGGNFPIPGSRECWEDGEKILTLTCAVN
jgi:hypothetical protein